MARIVQYETVAQDVTHQKELHKLESELHQTRKIAQQAQAAASNQAKAQAEQDAAFAKTQKRLKDSYQPIEVK